MDINHHGTPSDAFLFYALVDSCRGAGAGHLLHFLPSSPWAGVQSHTTDVLHTFFTLFLFLKQAHGARALELQAQVVQTLQTLRDAAAAAAAFARKIGVDVPLGVYDHVDAILRHTLPAHSEEKGGTRLVYLAQEGDRSKHQLNLTAGMQEVLRTVAGRVVRMSADPLAFTLGRVSKDGGGGPAPVYSSNTTKPVKEPGNSGGSGHRVTFEELEIVRYYVNTFQYTQRYVGCVLSSVYREGTPLDKYNVDIVSTSIKEKLPVARMPHAYTELARAILPVYSGCVEGREHRLYPRYNVDMYAYVTRFLPGAFPDIVFSVVTNESDDTGPPPTDGGGGVPVTVFEHVILNTLLSHTMPNMRYTSPTWWDGDTVVVHPNSCSYDVVHVIVDNLCRAYTLWYNAAWSQIVNGRFAIAMGYLARAADTAHQLLLLRIITLAGGGDPVTPPNGRSMVAAIIQVHLAALVVRFRTSNGPEDTRTYR